MKIGHSFKKGLSGISDAVAGGHSCCRRKIKGKRFLTKFKEKDFRELTF
jgi:hypothetical protein